MKKTSNINSSSLSSLVAGIGVGVYGASSFIVTGMVCPACLIITPTLIGHGIYTHAKHKDEQEELK